MNNATTTATEPARPVLPALNAETPGATVRESGWVVGPTAEESARVGFKVGDGVSWAQGSDRASGTVVRVAGQSVWVVEDEVSRPEGAEPYTQDWIFHPGSGEPIRFTFRRKTGCFKQAGASTRGSMASWGNLSHGRRYHYDYSF